MASGAVAVQSPQRIVSINLCADQWLLDMVPRERIQALSWLATDEGLSRIHDRVEGITLIPADAEAILRLKPDLVLAGRFGATMTVGLLRELDIPVYSLPYPRNLEEIAALAIELGDVLGEETRGQELATQIETAGARARMLARQHTQQPRLLLWREAGDVIGADTLEGRLLELAGGINLATVYGITGHVGLEEIVRLQPDRVAVLGHYSETQPAVLNSLRRHPALEASGVSVEYFPGNRFMCGDAGVIETLAMLQAFLQERGV